MSILRFGVSSFIREAVRVSFTVLHDHKLLSYHSYKCSKNRFVGSSLTFEVTGMFPWRFPQASPSPTQSNQTQPRGERRKKNFCEFKSWHDYWSITSLATFFPMRLSLNFSKTGLRSSLVKGFEPTWYQKFNILCICVWFYICIYFCVYICVLIMDNLTRLLNMENMPPDLEPAFTAGPTSSSSSSES